MAKYQWVNLVKDPKFVDSDCPNTERMGRNVFVRASFDKKDHPGIVRLYVIDDGKGKNAQYELPAEVALAADIGDAKISEGGEVEFEVELSTAGGDKFNFKAVDQSGTEKESQERFETRRRLYYQIIKMKGMKADVGKITAHMKKEFWSAGKKYFIQFKEIPSKGDMKHYKILDQDNERGVSKWAKLHYSDAMDPCCVAIILIDQNAEYKDDHTIEVSVGENEETVIVSCMARHGLWQFEESDKVLMEPSEFISNSDGSRRTLKAGDGSTPGDVTVVDKYPNGIVSVNTKGFGEGKLKLKLKIVENWWTGMSMGDRCAICVCTRTYWTQRLDSAMKSTLVHEMGHKIGMVPGSPGSQLIKQTTHYYRNGNHCNYKTDKCVLYDAIYEGRKDVFCSVCEKSVRRIDMNTGTSNAFGKPL